MSRQSDQPTHLTRRKILQVGAASVTAAFGTSAAGLLAQQPQQQTPPVAPPPFLLQLHVGGRHYRSVHISRGNVVRGMDLAPGRVARTTLDLNVVERNDTTTAPSPGQVFPGQFSFAGISPAPTIRVRTGGTIRIRLRNLLGANFGTIVGRSVCGSAVDHSGAAA
jgi:hypothetical protein